MSSRNILIPVVISNNRLRGDSTGAMVDDGPGEENLSLLRSVLKQEAIDAGVEPTAEWVSKSVRSILALYEKAQAAWVADPQGTVSHIYDAALPSGNVLRLGDRRALSRILT